jgi:hypothetical protein
MRVLLWGLILAFVVPLASHAVWWQFQPHAASWSQANWQSAGLLRPAADVPEATIHVLAGRTGRWKGIFAHHTWIVVKPRNATHYTRYDVVAWGRPIHVNSWAPDGRWYGNVPKIVTTVHGPQAERLIPRIEAAIKAYPYADFGDYTVWPGPNSNTFIAYIARHVPELAQALIPTAIGKDFAPWPAYAGLSPSRTGFQLSLGGLLGLTVGWVEGVEFNVLGLVTGIDLRRPALKLPGWGRLGLPASA